MKLSLKTISGVHSQQIKYSKVVFFQTSHAVTLLIPQSEAAAVYNLYGKPISNGSNVAWKVKTAKLIEQ